MQKTLKKQENHVASLFMYMSLENNAGFIAATRVGDRLNGIRGRSEDTGLFQLSFKTDKQVYGKSIIAHNYLVTAVPPNLGDLKHAILHNLNFAQHKGVEILSLLGNRMPEGMDEAKANFIVSQLTVVLPFEIDVLYESNSISYRPEKLTGSLFDSHLTDSIAAFNTKFENTFKLHEKSFSEQQIDFAKKIFSNLVGGISYFYGSSIVQSSYNLQPLHYWPASLYTAVPSRSFFPRGFLWDEGFHNLLISKWNKEISLDIISHWMQLINKEGWIPREQILGSEATARVPWEFVVQHNTNANPPTLFLTLEKLTKHLALKNSSESQEKVLFEKLYPRLVAWFQWFNNTQKSSKHDSAYCWKGRNATTTRELNPKTLTSGRLLSFINTVYILLIRIFMYVSGLDDYPRASHPSEDERHVDLRCWIAYMAKVDCLIVFLYIFTLDINYSFFRDIMYRCFLNCFLKINPQKRAIL